MGWDGMGWEGRGRTVVAGSDGEEDLSNVHTGYGPVGFSPCSAHPCLQPVGSGA